MDPSQLIGCWRRPASGPYGIYVQLNEDGSSRTVLNSPRGPHKLDQFEWLSDWVLEGDQICFAPCLCKIGDWENGNAVSEREREEPEERWIIVALDEEHLTVHYKPGDKTWKYVKISADQMPKFGS